MKKSALFFVVLIASAAISVPFTLGSAVVVQGPAPITVQEKKFPKGDFIVPVDSVLKIAGNFGEIRPNHFHAGLDIKTGGREGAFIYAAAEGYVSRIKISSFGYGKAIYVTHPNGYVTVYAHLQRLYGKLAKYLELEQYRLESYEVELFPDPTLLKVNQRDTIAISGNTGGSQSPHLHFEVRDAATEHAYNPFLFGYAIEDTVPPVISLLKIYPSSDADQVNGKSSPKKIGVFATGRSSRGEKGKTRNYKIPAQGILVNGAIGFGIETTDYGNIKEAGKLGAYAIDLYVDGKRIYNHEMNEIAFSESRYINSHIDYAEEAKSDRSVQKCFRDKNNLLSIYQCMVDEGLYVFKDTASHQVKVVVKDFFGNASVLEFPVKSTMVSVPSPKPANAKKKVQMFPCSEQNIYETADIKVEILPCALYEDVDFDYSMSQDTLPGTFSAVHSIHSGEVPLHFPYTLSIKTKPIRAALQSKATVVLLDGNNYKTDQKGEYRSGPGGSAWMTTQTKYFGRYAVALDTIPPSIRPYNIYSGKNMARAKTLAVIIGDNLTGIGSYRATIDGKWVLMEYEYKKAMLFHEFPPASAGQPAQKHVFEVTVTDGRSNARKYRVEFLR